jgi:hypothetical protein
MTKDDALRMMLGPFKAWRDVPGNEDVAEELTKIINAVEKVLAQPEQEPVANDPLPRACNLAGVDYPTFLKIKAYMPVAPPQRTEPIQSLQCFHCQVTIETLNDKVMQLLAQRTWVGLTDEERNDCLVSADPCETLAEPEARQLIEDVEQALREKNI